MSVEDIQRGFMRQVDCGEEEEEDREEAGVVSTVSRLLASPYKLFVYYLEVWIDGLVKRTSYEKY